MTRKRAVGEGTIYHNVKRARWEGQFSYVDPETGKTKRKLLTGKSQKEVANKGKNFLDGIKGGLLPNANKITVWQWLARWLEDYVKPKTKIKTYEKYEGCLRVYIKPPIGSIAMGKVKAPDVQRIFNNMLKNGGIKNQGVSTSTVRITRRYLTMAFDKAVEVGILARNVIKATDPPRLIVREIKPLSQEQAEKLLKIAQEGEYFYLDSTKQRRKPSPSSIYHIAMSYAVILLTLNTGMRLGEVFGLKWTDIDFAKNTANIQRALVSSTTQGMIFETPKTKGSRRRILITPKVKIALEAYQKEQQEYIGIVGDKYDDEENLVFSNLFGRPVDTSNFTTRYFKKMLVKAGLDRDFCFHDLRHTHATLLLKQGINIKVISERLGHSTITMTLDTYSHLMPDMQETAVKALEELNIG